MSVRIVVNGEPMTIAPGQTITELLQSLKIDPARVAVELDRRIVKQSQWSATTVAGGAEVEIVQFVGGG